ncbi:cleavage and polyadenylation specificity factor subunit 2 [Chytridiales sp. JEL 0842]|nr:cleavage and polyadenylation specificity factor subunit 2 [Chytridiales sp. JEL 0842]
MTSFIRFTAFSGALNEDPLCYMLQIDECRILLDCGWDGSFNADRLKALSNVIKQVDAVLLSHGDLDHLGAYPYCVSKLGLLCPVYSTLPVHDLGHMAMYDALHAKKNSEEYDGFTYQDVDNAFEKITLLRYSQPASLSGKCKGITITAYGAGHTLGGTIWKIKKDTDEIVYAVDYNHQKERHLSGTVLLGDPLSRPSLLITDSYNALVNQAQRRQRDAALFETMTNTLQSNGSVLIPIESATRSLELTYLLETYWSSNPEISRYPLFLLTSVSVEIINLAKRMLEWMGEGIASLLSQDRKAPYDFSYVRLVSTIEEVEKINGPKVVLASMSSLDLGMGRELFLNWAEDPLSTVILPDRGPPSSLARKLYDEWNSKSSSTTPAQMDFELSLMEKKKVALAGEELEAHLKSEQERKEEEAAKEEAKRSAFEEDDSDISDDEDGAVSNVKVSGGGAANQFDFYVKDTMRGGGFFKQNQSFWMFPVIETRRRVDDYGEVIDPAAFIAGDLVAAAALAEGADELPALEKKVIKKMEDDTPSKYVVEPLMVQVQCKVIFIDFEGRSDGKSIKNILPQVAPRKLIIVHGSEESTDSLRSFCEGSDNFTNEIFCPKPNELLNVSAATHIYQIKLTDSLVSSLMFAKFNDCELSYVSGIINIHEHAQKENDSAEEMETSEDESHKAEATAIPTLDLLPLEVQRAHRPVIIGDLKLSEFRRKLLEKGYDAEFDAGVLIVNRTFMIRRTQQGRLVLEGSFGRDYFKLRSMMYSEHAVVY